MTVLVALDLARPELHVTVSPAATAIGESTINLRPGERITVGELVEAALIQSANDAAWALAAGVGRRDVSAFVARMNAKARTLGLRDTRFVRPDGLDVAGHVSSARDVTLLARVAMRNPVIRSIVDERSGTISGGRRLHTWNDLLGTLRGTIGVKTGHTDRAGWSEVAAAKRDGQVLYTIVLGSPSRSRRNKDLAALLDWGFTHYARLRVIDPSREYATARVPYSSERVPLFAERKATAVVRLGQPLVEKVSAPAEIEPPVGFGEAVGEIRIYDGNRLVATRPLIAAQTVPTPGLTKKVGWYAGRALDEARDMLSSLSPF